MAPQVGASGLGTTVPRLRINSRRQTGIRSNGATLGCESGEVAKASVAPRRTRPLNRGWIRANRWPTSTSRRIDPVVATTRPWLQRPKGLQPDAGGRQATMLGTRRPPSTDWHLRCVANRLGRGPESRRWKRMRRHAAPTLARPWGCVPSPTLVDLGESFGQPRFRPVRGPRRGQSARGAAFRYPA